MHSRILTALALCLFTTFISAQSSDSLASSISDLGLTPSQTSAADSLGSSIASAALADPSSLGSVFNPASLSSQINSITGTDTSLPTDTMTPLTSTGSNSGSTMSTTSRSTTSTAQSSSEVTAATATSTKPSSGGAGAQVTAAGMAVGAGMMGVLGVAAML